VRLRLQEGRVFRIVCACNGARPLYLEPNMCGFGLLEGLIVDFRKRENT
jgi:hypothetical protein